MRKQIIIKILSEQCNFSWDIGNNLHGGDRLKIFSFHAEFSILLIDPLKIEILKIYATFIFYILL